MRKAAVFAAVLAGSVAARVHGQLSPEMLVAPPVSRAELADLEQPLGLSPEQVAAVEGVYEGACKAWAERAAKPTAEMRALLAKLPPDWPPLDKDGNELDEWQRYIFTSFKAEREREQAAEAFVKDMRTVLTGEQAARWELAEMVWRRRWLRTEGELEGVNLFTVVARAKLSDDERRGVEGVLEAYARELDEPLRETRKPDEAQLAWWSKSVDEMIRDAHANVGKNTPETDKKALAYTAASGERSRRMRAINRRYGALLIGSLTGQTRARLERIFHRGGYGHVYGPPRPGEERLAAARGLDGPEKLDDEQTRALEAIADAYRLESARLDAEAERVEDTVAERRYAIMTSHAIKTVPELNASFSAGWPVDAADRKAYSETRAKLEERIVAQIDHILSQEQKQKLAAAKPAK